eukprot:TRINITY_DN21923_c0_g1_i2.p1 TRINITY_DN21923_c0_g1~~TRINITY_DN21923_c0_g1_i2.p1  ORF type:complete len:551 (+),score=184.90 TRINITY_DN21923_c0_g1_i2:70-1653(+)
MSAGRGGQRPARRPGQPLALRQLLAEQDEELELREKEWLHYRANSPVLRGRKARPAAQAAPADQHAAASQQAVAEQGAPSSPSPAAGAAAAEDPPDLCILCGQLCPDPGAPRLPEWQGTPARATRRSLPGLGSAQAPPDPSTLEERERSLCERQCVIRAIERGLLRRQQEADATRRGAQRTLDEARALREELAEQRAALTQRERELSRQRVQLSEMQHRLCSWQEACGRRAQELADQESALAERAAELDAREKCLLRPPADPEYEERMRLLELELEAKKNALAAWEGELQGAEQRAQIAEADLARRREEHEYLRDCEMRALGAQRAKLQQNVESKAVTISLGMMQSHGYDMLSVLTELAATGLAATGAGAAAGGEPQQQQQAGPEPAAAEPPAPADTAPPPAAEASPPAVEPAGARTAPPTPPPPEEPPPPEAPPPPEEPPPPAAAPPAEATPQSRSAGRVSICSSRGEVNPEAIRGRGFSALALCAAAVGAAGCDDAEALQRLECLFAAAEAERRGSASSAAAAPP